MSTGWEVGHLRSTTAAGDREVLKLGGSLLTLPDWPAHAADLVRDRSTTRPVIVVVGGGPIVDGLRAIDASASGDPDSIHALAIELMRPTAQLVASALALPLVADGSGDIAAVLDAPRWLAAGERMQRLPVGWHVTSDSIAALVATEMHGDLILAKRVPPPRCDPSGSLAMLARAGWVDDHFPWAAANLGRIAWAAPRSVPEPAVGGPG